MPPIACFWLPIGCPLHALPVGLLGTGRPPLWRGERQHGQGRVGGRLLIRRTLGGLFLFSVHVEQKLASPPACASCPRHPDGIPAVCAAHISILRLSTLESGLCVTIAAFVCQAANAGQFMPCGIHSACTVLSGGGKCWQRMAVRPLLPFRALFGKEKPG